MFHRRQALAGFLAAPIAGAALFAAVPAGAQDAHGVIAFGETPEGEGVAYGFSWNFDGKDEAHAEAVNACVAAGGTDCVQLAWFQNGCGALATDRYGNAQGKPGMSLEQAEARALRTCEAAGGGGCNIVGSTCAAPGGEPGTWSGSESVLPAPGSQTTATGPEDESLTREERIRVQRSLTALGFDAGPADGVFGRRTRSAIREWQNASGLEATGHLTREQFATLTTVDASPTEEPESETRHGTADARNYVGKCPSLSGEYECQNSADGSRSLLKIEQSSEESFRMYAHNGNEYELLALSETGNVAYSHSLSVDGHPANLTTTFQCKDNRLFAEVTFSIPSVGYSNASEWEISKTEGGLTVTITYSDGETGKADCVAK